MPSVQQRARVPGARLFRLPTSHTPMLFPRLALLILGLLSALGLVYASIVPLEYRALPWDAAVAKFWRIPWLNLGVYHRADWVANGLAAMPFGFFLAGALDRHRRWSLLYALGLLPVILLGWGLVVGIEFLQIWFPRRTLSQNDILAGCIGATLGPLSWGVVGRPAVRLYERLIAWQWDQQRGTQLAFWLLMAFTFALLVYSVLPLDVMISAAEWRQKWNRGGFGWLPATEVRALEDARAWISLAITLGLSAGRLVPVGFLLGCSRRYGWTAAFLVGVPILIEVFQAPIYTRQTTLADVVCGWLGGAIGLGLAFAVPTLSRWNRSAALRMVLVLPAIAIVLAAFLGFYQRVSTETEVEAAWNTFWAPPLVKYYYTSEYMAGSNFAGKLIVFACLGAVLANAALRYRSGSWRLPQWWRGLLALVCVVAVGFTIEIAQVYLQPYHADASDALIYAAGAWLGWKVALFCAAKLLVPSEGY